MFCNLSYRLKTKDELRQFFFRNFNLTEPHKTSGSHLEHWRKIFDHDATGPLGFLISELNLEGLDVKPYFSFLYQNSGIPRHIDIDRIVGLNINLMSSPAVIRLDGKDIPYECALIDVGSVPHSVEATPLSRLVIKLSIRAPWSVILNRVEHLVVPSELEAIRSYNSVLTDENAAMVRC